MWGRGRNSWEREGPLVSSNRLFEKVAFGLLWGSVTTLRHPEYRQGAPGL